MMFDAAPMMKEAGGRPPITSTVKWSRAGTSWSISSDGYTATRSNGSTSADSVVVANTLRSTGSAAFTIILDPGEAPSSRSAFGLYPDNAILSNGAYQDNSVTWQSDGSVRVGSSGRSGSSTTWSRGDEVGFLLDSAGTTLQLIKNGVILGRDFNISIPKVARTPGFVSQNGSKQVVLLNGAPEGFPAWG